MLLCHLYFKSTIFQMKYIILLSWGLILKVELERYNLEMGTILEGLFLESKPQKLIHGLMISGHLTGRLRSCTCTLLIARLQSASWSSQYVASLLTHLGISQ